MIALAFEVDAQGRTGGLIGRLRERRAGPQLQRRFLRIDQLAALARVLFRQQRVVRNLDEVHVAEEFLAIGHRELDRLDARVDVVGRVQPHLLHVVPFEQVQRDQLGGALIGRRVLVNLVAAIVGRHRRLDLRRIFREVFVAEQAAVLFRELRHLARDVAFVEAIARGLERLVPPFALRRLFRFDEFLQRSREIDVLEDGARLRRLAARHVDAHRRRILPNLLRAGQLARQPLAERKSLFRELDGGLQQLLERHRAPVVEQQIPRVDNAGNPAREEAVALRQLPAVVLLIPLDRREARRARLRVDRHHLLRLRVVEQEHGVAADAVGRKVGDGERRLSRDGGVERVAATLKNAPRRFGGFGAHRRDRRRAPADDRPHRAGARCLVVLRERGGRAAENESECEERMTHDGCLLTCFVAG